jgi:hypothetical protein
LSVDAGVERLSLTRTLSNAAVEQATQRAGAFYPVVAGEARLLNIYDAFYAGVGVSLYPVRQLGLRLNDETMPLSPVSGTGIAGFSF